jgi:hypothetical protein
MSTLRERFLAKVEPITESGCWIWMGSLRNGRYGQIGMPRSRKVGYAHRVSFQLFNGEIPEGHEVCHRCDVTQCVNPSHLYSATHVQNIADTVNRGQSANVPRDKVERIRQLLAQGMTQTDVAKEVGTSRTAVRYWGVRGVRRIKATAPFIEASAW